MMRRLTLLLTLCVTLAACEDETTGPATIDLRLAAWTFDALSRSRLEAGDGNGALAARHTAFALRAGIRPTRVSITVDGVTEDYLALETEHAFGDEAEDPISPAPLVIRTMVAWRGGRPDRFLAISVLGDTGIFTPFRALELEGGSSPIDLIGLFGVLFDRGGPAFVGVAGGARTTRQSIGAACDVPQRASFTPLLRPISCHHAVFLTRFIMTADELGTFPSGIRSRVVQMGSQSVVGVRFEYPSFPTACPVC